MHTMKSLNFLISISLIKVTQVSAVKRSLLLTGERNFSGANGHLRFLGARDRTKPLTIDWIKSDEADGKTLIALMRNWQTPCPTVFADMSRGKT